MSTGPAARVLDSWGLLAFLKGEPAAEKVEAFLASAQDDGAELLVTTVNLAEVWYSIARSRSEAEADDAVAKLCRLGLRVVDADWELAREAARFKAKHGIAFADCFAAALAKLRNVEIVTGDPVFQKVEDEVSVRWL